MHPSLGTLIGPPSPVSDHYPVAQRLQAVVAPGDDGETPATDARRRAWSWRLSALGIAIWTLLGLREAVQVYFFPDSPAFTLSWPRALAVGLGLWYTWGLLWLLVFPLIRRFPLGQHHWFGRLALYMAACVGFAAIKLVLDYPVVKLFLCPTPEKLTFPLFLKMAFADQFLRYILYYWAMIGVGHALNYYSKFRDGELRSAQLEIGLARARLSLLKTQLQPHFLFNTLNAISALVHTDAETADRMLARLGDLLRLALEDFGVQEAPLARELEVLRSYLDIEQTRLGDRLTVCWNVGPDTTDALVPTFLLQPIVENAIHHGIAPRAEPGRIEIGAWRHDGMLHLHVRDDGPGLRAGVRKGGGVGLANTRARLLHLYGAAQWLEAGNDPRGGCVIKVALPFRAPVKTIGEDTVEETRPAKAEA
jgi:signal transduction histidine kinase